MLPAVGTIVIFGSGQSNDEVCIFAHRTTVPELLVYQRVRFIVLDIIDARQTNAGRVVRGCEARGST